MVTLPFSPDGDTEMMVTPDSTFDESSSPMHQDQVASTLEQLQLIWNRLDLHELGPVFVSNNKRRLYLKDMVEIRHGGRAYYSLGGDDRMVFGSAFAQLDRKVQELLRASCARCLHEGRFLHRSDLEAILHEARGKRQTLSDWDILQQQRPAKRQRGPVSMQCW